MDYAPSRSLSPLWTAPDGCQTVSVALIKLQGTTVPRSCWNSRCLYISELMRQHKVYSIDTTDGRLLLEVFQPKLRWISWTRSFFLHLTFMLRLYCIHCSSIKIHSSFFCDNFPKCKPIQIIFCKNIAEKICYKQTHDNFDTHSLCVASLHHKMAPIFLSIL